MDTIESKTFQKLLKLKLLHWMNFFSRFLWQHLWIMPPSLIWWCCWCTSINMLTRTYLKIHFTSFHLSCRLLDEGFEPNRMNRRKKQKRLQDCGCKQWPKSDACKLKYLKNIDQNDDISIPTIVRCFFHWRFCFTFDCEWNELFLGIHISGKRLISQIFSYKYYHQQKLTH